MFWSTRCQESPTRTTRTWRAHENLGVEGLKPKASPSFNFDWINSTNWAQILQMILAGKSWISLFWCHVWSTIFLPWFTPLVIVVISFLHPGGCPLDSKCHVNASCIQQDSGSVWCQCHPGFTGNGTDCQPETPCDNDDGHLCPNTTTVCVPDGPEQVSLGWIFWTQHGPSRIG